jgi:hypothetical protein
MRELKKGDRCEARTMTTEDLKPKLCNVRHMEGTPPQQLLQCRRDRKVMHLCREHQANLSGISVTRRGRKKSVAPEQLDLTRVDCAGMPTQLTSDSRAAMDAENALVYAKGFRLPMPESWEE